MKYTARLRSTKPRLLASTSPWAAAAIGPLEPGCRIVGATNGRFSLLDMVLHAIEETGPAHLVVASWVCSEGDALKLLELERNGKALSVRLMVDRTPPRRGRMNRIEAEFGDRMVRMNTHAKFAILTNDAWAVTIRGSANLNPNPRLEYLEIDDNREIADFLLALVDRAAKIGAPDKATATQTLDQVIAPDDAMNEVDDPDPDGLDEILEGW